MLALASGKRLLDYGCGVRFTRTLINLGMDIGAYAGIASYSRYARHRRAAAGRRAIWHFPWGLGSAACFLSTSSAVCRENAECHYFSFD